MDFLTRLAQRLTGELPAVQPRLRGTFLALNGSIQSLSCGIAAWIDQVEPTMLRY